MRFGSALLGASWMVAVFCGLAGAPAPAAAQVTYNCLNASGQRYLSHSPCPASRPPGLIYYGPQAPAPRPSVPVPVARADEELTYMSPRCASMREGIRTAPARGVDHRTQSELLRNYQAECAQEQAEARSQLRAEQQAKRREQQDAKRQANADKQLAAADHEKLMSQCAEMRGAIRQRRARTGMTEGELRDLALFEQRYEARCSAPR